METYQILQIFVLFYTIIVIFFTIFINFFQFKYRKYNKMISNQKIGRILNKLRGKMTILLPLKIMSIIFIVSWGILFVTFIDFVWKTNIFYTYHFKNDGTLVTWIGDISNTQGNYYFFILFLSTTIGAKGYLLLKDITRKLSDTSLAIGPEGLKYQKEVF